MKYIIVTLIFININISFSQEPHPLEFFPHHKGDIFEYADKSEWGFWQNIIIKDSLGENGRYYLDTRYFGDYPISTYFGKWSIDTVENEVYRGYQETWPELKLDADTGDVWIAYVDTLNNRFVQAELVDVFPAIVLGEDVIVKTIDYVGYEIIDSDTMRGLYYSSYYLASKFGIIAEYGDPPFEPVYYLRGAKIDGVTYGIVSSIKEEPEAYPKDFILLQNYPNPFNPSTTIKYNLSKSSNVILKIHNTLGEEVTTLIEEYQIQGSYQINFNTRNLPYSKASLPSGVYFYSITAGNFHQVKKMVLAK